MANRIFISAVVVFWLSSMTWLVTDRILPSFYGGQPPTMRSYEDGKAVAWEVLWKGKTVGEAASMRLSGVAGSTDLFNRVVLDEFPVMQLAPSWIRATVGNLGEMTFDVLTRVEFDPLGTFSSFNSRISLDAMPSILKMSGRIEESFLKLNVQSGDIRHTTKIFLPNSEALSEALFPTAKLPYMHVGRHWQEKVYSPFRSPSDPVELVQVEVKEIETIQHRGESLRVMRVEYRSVAGSGIPEQARIQGISWVEPKSGDVLRRDVFLGDSKLRFERLPKEAAVSTGLKLFADQLRTATVDPLIKNAPLANAPLAINSKSLDEQLQHESITGE